MKTRQLIVEPLTASAFAGFGEVIEVDDNHHHYTINEGFTERYHQLAKVQLDSQEDNAIISIFRTTPLAIPLVLRSMECHPLGSQAFMPLSNLPYLVVVAAKGELNEGSIRAFLAKPGQGVNYFAGTWHHFCLALYQQSDFLVIDRAGKGDNCLLHQLMQPIELVLNVE